MTDDERLKANRGMESLESLIYNKFFLVSVITTMEKEKRFFIREKYVSWFYFTFSHFMFPDFVSHFPILCFLILFPIFPFYVSWLFCFPFSHFTFPDYFVSHFMFPDFISNFPILWCLIFTFHFPIFKMFFTLHSYLPSNFW